MTAGLRLVPPPVQLADAPVPSWAQIARLSDDTGLLEHARKGIVCDHLHPVAIEDDPLAPWLRFFETTDVYGMVEE